MQLSTKGDGKRRIKLTNPEQQKLRQASAILRDLREFSGLQNLTLGEALERIGVDGVFHDEKVAGDAGVGVDAGGQLADEQD